MREEAEALLLNETFHLPNQALPPFGVKQLSTKWVYKLKINADNSIRYKARLVVRGFEQVEGQDYDETYAPVSRLTTLRFILSTAAFFGFKVEHLDVTSAFLHPRIDRENLWISPPDGAEHLPSSLSTPLRLKKALYGLKQSPKLWYEDIHQSLIKLSFEQSVEDPNLYIKAGVMVLLYVDDILLVYTDPSNDAAPKEVKESLMSTYKMTDLGTVKRFLGIDVASIPSEAGEGRDIIISQETYLKALVAKYDPKDSLHPSKTPMMSSVDLFDGRCQDTLLSDAEQKTYASMVGSFMYASVGTRPDISYAVLALSRFTAKPLKKHQKAATHLLRYIKGTLKYQLRYRCSNEDVQPELVAFTDADWAGNSATRKSVSGSCAMHKGSSPVNWSSKSQTCVALSTVESEFIAASKATRELLCLRQLTEDVLGYKCKPITLYCDNDGAISLIRSGIFKARTKHIDVNYRHIIYEQETGTISICRVNSAENPADIFTKALDEVKVSKFNEMLHLAAIPDLSDDVVMN